MTIRDNLTKLRALIDMKGHLIEALRKDIASAAAKIDVLRSLNQALAKQNKELQRMLDTARDDYLMALNDIEHLTKELDNAKWWKAIDEEMCRKEAEERADEIQHHIEIEVQQAETQAAEEEELNSDIPF